MSLKNNPKISANLPNRSQSPAIRLLAISILLSLTFIALNVFPANANSTVNRVSKTDPTAKLKNELEQAQKDASAAATRYSQAYGALEKLNDELADTQNRLDSAEGAISELQIKASTQAKNAYIRMSEDAENDSYEKRVDETRRDKLLSTVSEFDDAQRTTLVSLKEDLQIAKDELSAIQKDKKDTVAKLALEKKALDDKLAAATKAKKDLDAKLAKEAKAKKASTSKASTSRSTGSGRSSAGVGTIINPGNGPMACPIAGPIAFSNDWGQPRSGGRTHKGNDLFSPRGTPNVAVVSGTVFFQSEGTGGLSAYVSGGGNTYYYTHLNSIVGGPRTVSRGEVIGYTGSTGNANGSATHTHFEIRQGGPNGNRVNPYATLRSVC
jgi:murein DD-endopeptidase MepM/ murein hydrolase activator NlpD